MNQLHPVSNSISTTETDEIALYEVIDEYLNDKRNQGITESNFKLFLNNLSTNDAKKIWC